MRGKLIAAAALVSVGFVGLIVVAVRTWQGDREALMVRFASDRAHQLDEALTEIEAELGAVADDLRLAVRLVSSADSPDDRERELGALVSVAREYLEADVCDRAGTRVLQVPGEAPQLGADQLVLDDAVLDVCRAAAARPGRVHTSPPVSAQGRAVRIFGLASEAGVAVALVLDIEAVFGRLRIVAADPDTRLVVLGAHGLPAPFTDPTVAAALARPGDALPTFARLAGQLRARDTGQLRLPAAEARALGMGDAEVIALYRPIRIEGGAPWSAALLSSTAALAEHDRGMWRRMVAIVALVAVMFAALAAFVILTTRRTIALRERVRRANEVEHHREKTEKILDTIPTGVVVLGEDGLVTAVNAYLRDRLGPVTGTLARCFPDADEHGIEQLEALVAAARTAGAPRSVFGETLTIFGRVGSYNLHAVALAPRFADARVLLVIEDLSMLGSLERQLVRSAKLATVGILAAGIAHEVGTPLGVARGRAEYLQGKLGPAHPQAGGLGVIVEQIDQVSRTIRRLLDFARMQPSEERLAVSVLGVARGVAELLAAHAERCEVRLVVEGRADVMVESAPDQLQQALVNLVMNACDACEPGGEIRIACELAGADTARIVVADDGRGIADEHRPHVFDPFFTTKKRGKGTGLGLSIVAQTVRNHGGTVELDSQPGGGTTVTILWPTARRRVE